MSGAQVNIPAQFEDLSDLVHGWSFPTERERKERRATASMEELQTYYDRLKDRVPAIAQCLNEIPYESQQLDPAHSNLLQLAYMYMEAAMAVEFFRRPEPKNAFPRDRFIIEDIRIRA